MYFQEWTYFAVNMLKMFIPSKNPTYYILTENQKPV